MAYVERKVGRAAEGFQLRQRHRGGHTTEEQGVKSGVEDEQNDAAERPSKTTKFARKCDTCPGRCWGIDTALEMGKNLRIIQH